MNNAACRGLQDGVDSQEWWKAHHGPRPHQGPLT